MKNQKIKNKEAFIKFARKLVKCRESLQRIRARMKECKNQKIARFVYGKEESYFLHKYHALQRAIDRIMQDIPNAKN